MAVRDLPERKPGAESGDGGAVGSGDRSRLQREPLQFGPRSDDLAFACLESFTKNVLRYTATEVVLQLATHDVKRELNLTEDQRKTFEAALLGWWKKNKMWPEGF